ncbi:hypothetical protein SAMN04487975_101376 [Planococcus glaciei]|uniref:hypothetical protein n=1 Tax=Planococcus glaciei TaxID=459472 RepID=UPI00087DF59A|nr:hypothetical protein [Planococcus glaciei]SDG74979.1 hypothetical protein SAMN04487975_101376 [Planococcus glaciei]
MASVLAGDTWTRKGISLLWDSLELTSMTEIKDVVSIRSYLNYFQNGWPEDLPSAEGYSLVVSGLDMILDVMEPTVLTNWLENEFYSSLLSFQSTYEGQSSLVFWIPDAQKRLVQKTDGIYYWNCGGSYHGKQIPLSQCLWNGAAKDAKMITKNPNIHEIKDKSCIGIYHPRIS